MNLIFAGSPQIAADALAELAKHHSIKLVLTMPDAPVGRNRVLTPTPVASVAQELGIKTLKLKKFNQETLEQISSSGAELAVVLAFGALVPKDALGLLPWLNLHYSLLPKWRGASPLQHSILTAQGQGITIFQLDEGMDTGPVLRQVALELDPNKTTGELLGELTQLGIENLLQLLEDMPTPTAQRGEKSHAPKITREKARILFSNRATEIHRLVMAMNPEPVAWCEFAGAPMRILRTKSLGEVNWNGLGELDLEPGQVCVLDGRVLVGCGDGTRLELLELQPAGKKAMPAGDWIRGINGGVRFE